MKAVIKYRLHPSIIAIKEKCVSSFSFSFSQVERDEIIKKINDEIIKEINNLKTNKATQSIDIPTKLIKKNSDIFGDFIFENFNNSVFYLIFSSPMKNTSIPPVYKKDTKTSKGNYRSVSILPNVSKIYEQLMFKQISEFFEPILSKFQGGFRKGFSAQHCLL